MTLNDFSVHDISVDAINLDNIVEHLLNLASTGRVSLCEAPSVLGWKTFVGHKDNLVPTFQEYATV